VPVPEEQKTAASSKVKSVSKQEIDYTPVRSLNTFLFDWKIKARVTKKYPKKDWKNARGAGKLLNIELIDK
jgi:ssDNA-binding replication factor A large subunit